MQLKKKDIKVQRVFNLKISLTLNKYKILYR